MEADCVLLRLQKEFIWQSVFCLPSTMGYVYGRPRLLLLVAVALAVSLGSVGVEALTAREWRKQSIYQVMVDRFARTDLSTTAQCDTSRQAYCGGTWRGLISKLDYIQGMGFTAVWISPVTRQINGESRDGSSYHGYWAQDIWSLVRAIDAQIAAQAADIYHSTRTRTLGMPPT